MPSLKILFNWHESSELEDLEKNLVERALNETPSRDGMKQSTENENESEDAEM